MKLRHLGFCALLVMQSAIIAASQDLTESFLRETAGAIRRDAAAIASRHSLPAAYFTSPNLSNETFPLGVLCKQAVAAVDPKLISQTEDPVQRLAAIALEPMVEQLMDGQALRVPVCIVFSRDQRVNAYAELKQISGSDVGVMVINQGVARIVKNDSELAAILAHELSHLMLRHTYHYDQLYNWTAKGTWPRVVDCLWWNNPPPLLIERRRMELEADRFGVLLSARAGYDPRGAVAVMENPAVQHPQGRQGQEGDHPSRDIRLNKLEAAVRDSTAYPISSSPISVLSRLRQLGF